jgi:hypothetical protein
MKAIPRAVSALALAIGLAGCLGDSADDSRDDNANLTADEERDGKRQPEPTIAELSLEAYFQRITEFEVEAPELTELGDECDDLEAWFGLELTEDSWEEYRDEAVRLNRCLLATSDPVEAHLASIEPPTEVAATHERWVQARRAYWDEAREDIRELESARSPDDVMSAMAHPNYGPKEDQDDACNELQRIAQDNDIDVDLLCNEYQ